MTQIVYLTHQEIGDISNSHSASCLCDFCKTHVNKDDEATERILKSFNTVNEALGIDIRLEIL